MHYDKQFIDVCTHIYTSLNTVFIYLYTYVRMLMHDCIIACMRLVARQLPAVTFYIAAVRAYDILFTLPPKQTSSACGDVHI